jgi:pyruvate/2-oxoglutarate dehydrogenase complex dihydrolipoamide acyltransferase (E2) component
VPGVKPRAASVDHSDMKSQEASTFARFGGALLAVSLVLPYFAISFVGLASHGFRLWEVDKGAFVLVAAYSLFALAQVTMGSRDSMALIYLVVGGLFTAALVYRIFISPPGSGSFGAAFSGAGGSGSFKVNGKSMAGVSSKDFLKALGIELKPSYGSYVALLGSVFFSVGAFLEFRASGRARDVAAATPAQPAAPQPVSPAQRYQPPSAPAHALAADPFATPAQQQAAVARQPAAPAVPPDPFAPKPVQQPAAVAQQPAAPAVPPDPFAPKPVQQPAAPQPYVPPGPAPGA